ncbi:BadF/BadG/BcrA/BcrD ATPase family protein [Terrisporobacter mayombei]|uniref:N-acetylmuramic acid/N-acetylglucosamine kinase n=1 Tax=Terrisporobacter mayombei TaxID=1541 RepID=A0ABY9Q1B6_9FIRM|nr:BadF/BadG/BcrA/BcrD ATPase family protein [Terrisporobacter mayombei]MCC3866774.1 N-acetylglucosamine kinase [Terrisporobacter mayombei]WMT81011.1 N-acetylmuramic acid/N-acetylglucosamine kinase [Terrisporobacter mayombei]
MSYLVSVDGGGTKTQFTISNLSGKILGNYQTGSSNYKSVGIDAAYQNLNLGLEEIYKDLNINKKDIIRAVFGISGYDSQDDYELIFNMIKKTGLKEEQIYLYNDSVLAFYAQADEPGVVIISGTGSIVLGINSYGKILRRGGWGYNFSDLGSGYEIGRKALRETLLYCDGCRKYSILFDYILRYYEESSFNNLPYKITSISNNYEIANIATLVILAADLKDYLAMEILEESAKDLSVASVNVLNNISKNSEDKLSIVLSGGVFNSKLYRKLVTENIKEMSNCENLRFILQDNNPVYGGLKLAKKLLK